MNNTIIYYTCNRCYKEISPKDIKNVLDIDDNLIILCPECYHELTTNKKYGAIPVYGWE